MELSILVTAFQRANLLKCHLQSLAKQTKNFEYEILVLNDGLEDDTKSVCDQFSGQLPIKYIFTGQRNINGIQWRVPGYAINIGIKQATGKSIIITCAEMYLLNDMLMDYQSILSGNNKAIVITEGLDDRVGTVSRQIEQQNGESIRVDIDKRVGIFPLHTKFPFFMGINREQVLKIGGYDEDFTGYAYDDGDFVHRLENFNCHFITLPYKVLHLYHKRLVYSDPVVKVKVAYNEKLYRERAENIQANQGREWGVYNV